MASSTRRMGMDGGVNIAKSSYAGKTEQNNLTVIDPPRMMEFVGKMMSLPLIGYLLNWWQSMTGAGHG